MVARAMEHTLIVTSSSLSNTVSKHSMLRLNLLAPPTADMVPQSFADDL